MFDVPPPPPPTVAEAKVATRMATEQTAALFDGSLRVGACPRKGTSSRVCAAEIRGDVPMRLRVVVTQNHAGDFMVRARFR